jgi:16S rRNA (cytosine967-C5)-methyltransferase
VSWPERSDGIRYLSVRYSVPEWIVAQWSAAYGEEKTEIMLQASLADAPTSIRCNVEKITPDDLETELTKIGINVKRNEKLSYAMTISGYDYLADIPAFEEGKFHVQDVSSMYVTETADPKEGDFVLDVCAAPGGKSLHMAEKLHGTGMVEARDLTEYKVSLIEDNIFRSGLSNIRAVCADATVPDASVMEKADIVIADLPCSGLGVLSKKTDLKYRMSEAQQKELIQLQRQILSTVWQYVKPGGTLVYSTCTVHKGENEENAQWFEETYPFTKITEKQYLPGIDGGDGFYIAKFRRE